MNLFLTPKRTIALLGSSFLACTVWLVWIAWQDPALALLPAKAGAPWIICPKPPDANPHKPAALPAEFRIEFLVPTLPSSATIELRAFKWAAVTLNGRLALAVAADNWKQPARAEVIGLFVPGTNLISVVVSNDFGPPALSLALETDQAASPLISSSPAWQVSLGGGAWQAAAFASGPPAIRPGNDLYGWSTIPGSFRRVWPFALMLLAISAALFFAFRVVCGLQLPPGPNVLSWLRNPAHAVLTVCLLAWFLLFANNLRLIPPLLGFDRDGHLDYISFILDKGSLPLASDGWQMYQPPLYYVLSAALLFPTNLNASSESAVLALRLFTGLIGLVNILLVFASLRVIFPSRSSAQAVGTMIAGFLPAHLYVSHHVTNEVLAAAMATAALYFSLRAVRSETKTFWLAAAAGTCLGLSLLAKFSAVLILPLLLLALACRAEAGDQTEGAGSAVRIRFRLSLAAVALLALVITCGWHYARVWHAFGNPFIGNWDRSLPFAWWQEPGYRTAGFYTSIGPAFVLPAFSSIHSFWDGLYSSLWGDALGSGASRFTFRPPWNYDSGNVGYVLALVPMGLILLGFLRTLAGFVRRPTAESGLLLGVVLAFVFGIAYMTLRVPSYAQVKAVYALPLLLPLCAFGVAGWEWISIRSHRMRTAATALLVAWAGSVLVTFWIRSWDPHTHVSRGISFADESDHAQALTAFQRALQADPSSVAARAGLAASLQAVGRLPEAQAQVDAGLPLVGPAGTLRRPEDADLLFQAATLAIRQRENQRAIELLQRLVNAAPDHPSAWRQLAVCLSSEGREPEALRARQQALRINPYDVQQQQQQAESCARVGDPASAIRHYGFALVLQPDNTETLNNLAWLLATTGDARLRDGGRAAELARTACELTRNSEPALLGTLAACLAETGQFEEAATTAGQAVRLAETLGKSEIAEANRRLHALYQNRKTARALTP